VAGFEVNTTHITCIAISSPQPPAKTHFASGRCCEIRR
jgi:hypothetical protein